ncbi:MAG: UDP-N-acetylmuramoyl-tripeptide--D-alanyl-D-alanine ligase [Deltaproteobacteria bacterium]|nr:UDP-N-acetylmuramoyl-tripeptide--D-alanyl-D-alanine ligase [Deltaproteobacteria bacterium]
MATPIPINQCVFNAAEIIRATGALFSGDPSLRVRGVSIDTRNIWPGAVFIALRGMRDGHEFIDAAARAQAAAAIVERGRRHNALPCFEVDDTLCALGALARHHLERFRALHSLPIVAVGGAAGKTTTKELVAALMRELFGEILATPGNLNNLIGVPMTLLTLTGGHRAAVLECGTNQRGEIGRLGDILRPDIALVLNVDVEHTEGLGSLEGVADEEAALFSRAHCAIVSVSEELLTERVPAGMRTITFGIETAADVRLVSRTVIAPGRQQIKLDLAPWIVDMALPHHLEAMLNLLGGPIAENAAAAVAAAAAAWGRPLGGNQIAALAQALGSVQSVPGRLSTSELNGITIIDDTYNANPRSVRAALTAARETADILHTRLIVVVGDMLELGELSPMMHATAVRDVFAARPEQFIAVGREFRAAINHLSENGSLELKVHMARDSREAAAVLRGIIRRGDVLLVKGSRAIGMEHAIDSLSAA